MKRGFKINIRPIKKEDLKILNEKLKVKEFPNLHEEKLKEQEKENTSWFIVWKGKKPLARFLIRFDGSEIKKVRANLKRCPHLESLYVKEKFRKKGIATKLMKFSENLVKKKGFKQIGLAVVKDNSSLLNLYMKEGYRDWKRGIVIETREEVKGKKTKKVSEKCKYLVKKLK